MSLLYIIGAFAWVSLAILVGRDAANRGHPNGILWLFFVLVTGIYGTLVYLLVRKPHPNTSVSIDSKAEAIQEQGQ